MQNDIDKIKNQIDLLNNEYSSLKNYYADDHESQYRLIARKKNILNQIQSLQQKLIAILESKSNTSN